MFGKRGQLSVNLVWVVVGMLIAVAIGGLVYSAVDEATSEAVATNEYELSDLSGWTYENTAPLAASYNSTDNWADVTATASGSGTATISSSADVDAGLSVESATYEVAYQIDNADDLTDENIEIRLVSPDGTTTVLATKNHSTTQAWTNLSYDISNYITEDGTYTAEVYTEATVTGTGFETNYDNATVSIDTESAGEMAQGEAGSGASTIFPLLVVIVIVSVIIAIMKLFGGI